MDYLYGLLDNSWIKFFLVLAFLLAVVLYGQKALWAYKDNNKSVFVRASFLSLVGIVGVVSIFIS